MMNESKNKAFEQGRDVCGKRTDSSSTSGDMFLHVAFTSPPAYIKCADSSSTFPNQPIRTT